MNDQVVSATSNSVGASRDRRNRQRSKRNAKNEAKDEPFGQKLTAAGNSVWVLAIVAVTATFIFSVDTGTHAAVAIVPSTFLENTRNGLKSRL